MSSEKNYRLTGGVFFLLISNCLKKTGKTEVDCLSELVAIFDGTDKHVSRKTMRSNTTQYKKCELDNSMFLPFGNKDLQEAFRNRLEQDYASVLAEVASFTKKFISPKDYTWLASSIVDILRHDSSATESQFRILSNGNAVSYQELLDTDYIEIEPFLTGIWGFILCERPYNTVGVETFHALTIEPETKGSPRLFVSDIGKSQKIRVASTKQEDTLPTLRTFIQHNKVEMLTENFLAKINSNVVPAAEIKNEEAEYFSRLKKDYGNITTLLYSDNPQPFYDFYICNNIYRFEGGRSKKKIYIENVTVNALLDHSNYVLLSGNGGLGKSMMMRHLLLDCVNRYEEVSLLPIFIELRSFAENSEELADCAYRVYTNYGGHKSRAGFDELLKTGDILLLCDGLDEIPSGKRMHFQQELERFAVTFPENVVVISSRPFGPFGSYASVRRFTVFYLEPFSKSQALTLVKKLKFHEEEPRIKQSFMDALNNGLYNSHRSFAENPLLLTIMMLMYAEIGNVPPKMHLFYNEAFQVLARKHDASKGGFVRPLATRLDVESFKEVFTEFCARTYKDELIELTENQMEMYYTKVKASYKGNIQWNYEAFTEDLTSNLCLMFFESLKYHFIHRSFQEYFCARYISKRLDKNLYTLTKTIFENKNNRYYFDYTFAMLYDMIPKRIEENVFIPFLREIFMECDKKSGYRTFLQIVYPEISYNVGETAADYVTESPFFLYRFILRIADITFLVGQNDFPYERDFVMDTYVELDKEWLERNDSSERIVLKQDVPWDYSSELDDPEEVGYNLAFDTELILDEPQKYPEITALLLSEDFALMKEYKYVRAYYEDLVKQHSQTQEDVFELM